jgi:6-phosphogluconolactonase
LHAFASQEGAAAALSMRIAAALREGLMQRGRASLLVPGGRTPLLLFRALRRCDLDWGAVQVGLTDERWVSEASADSNARLVRGELLQERAARAELVPLFSGAPSASAGAGECWRVLSRLLPPFDAVVLGMGEDGHIASLFPGAAGVAAALDAAARPGCVAVHAPAAPRERISLNLAALAQARELFLLVHGARKREVIEAAGREVEPLRDVDATHGAQAPTPSPIGALLKLHDPRAEVYWSP